MKKQSLLRALTRTVAALAVAAAASSSALASYNQVVFFGDSLSDTGNLYAITGGAIPASPPYYNGQFSNGPVWTQDFAAALGLSATPFAYGTGGTNYAIAGATMGYYADATAEIPVELGLYLGATSNVADPNALYVILGGGNDIKYAAALDAATAVSNVTNAALAVDGMVQTLYAAGARNILVANLPDIGKTPLASVDAATSAGATALTQIFNSTLAAALAGSEAAFAGLDLDTLDLYGLMNSVIADPTGYGFSNVTDACKSGDLGVPGTVCANPDSYLFWDAFHPTAKAHMLIADAALRAVPEPGALMLAIAGLAAVFWSRSRARAESVRPA
jgi:phospholipase/lecithinase/hemolysin